MRNGRLALSVAFAALAWLVAGRIGLLVGAAVALASLLLRPPASALWVGGVLAMAAAPVALIAEGLSAIGPGFARAHLTAHALVGLSLALVSFAALLELTGLDRTAAVAPSEQLRRGVSELRERVRRARAAPGPEPDPGPSSGEAPPPPSTASSPPPPD